MLVSTKPVKEGPETIKVKKSTKGEQPTLTQKIEDPLQESFR